MARIMWGRVLFTDEKIFRISSNRRGEFITRTIDEKYSPHCIQGFSKGGFQVHVWAGIGWRGTSPLIRIQGTLNAHQYQNQVLQNVREIGNTVAGFGGRGNQRQWIFQQDNAPAHTARTSRQFLEEENITLLEWPPNSPDLSPIENLWAFVSARVPRTPVHDADEFFERISAVWEEVAQNLLTKLFRSMPRRIGEVIKRRGYPTHY